MKETHYPYLTSSFHNVPGRSDPFLEGSAEFLAEERKGYCNELSTPLHVALVEYEDAEDLRELIQETPDINAQDADGHTPLHAAAEYGCKETVEILLQAGADAGILNAAGKSPADLAREKAYMVIVNMLYPRQNRLVQMYRRFMYKRTESACPQ